MTRKQAASTDEKSVPTSTCSEPWNSSTKVSSQHLQEMLDAGSWNPFQRVPGTLLEKLQREAAKRVIRKTEDAWL